MILERIPEPRAKPTRAKPALELSAFQPVERDFAFVVDGAVKAADLVRAAQGAERKLITQINVFDVYEGEGIPPGKKSIALAVTAATARQDHDGPARRSTPWRQITWLKWASGPAEPCAKVTPPGSPSTAAN